ncbi:MAG: hypothetical protein Q9191_001217 [Dirinaria sp. TL-2023a]
MESLASAARSEDPERTVPIPQSPPPTYSQLALDTTIVLRPAVVVHARDLSPVPVSSSLPNYRSVSPGPPTDFMGYYNYVVPGMELGQVQGETGAQSSSNWIPMRFVTNPSPPVCEGMRDGSCPLAIHGLHNSGPYYHQYYAPSLALIAHLDEMGTSYLFEGSNPTPEIWQAWIARTVHGNTAENEDVLFRFRWYHCPLYRARVIARRQVLDVTSGVVWQRRQRRAFLREIGALPERTDLSPIQGIEEIEAQYMREAEARYTAIPPAGESPTRVEAAQGSAMPVGEEIEEHPSIELDTSRDINPDPLYADFQGFMRNSRLEVSIEADPNSPVQTTVLTLPSANPHYRHAYLRYGLVPPSAGGFYHGTISAYPFCRSPDCPLAHIAHRQGPWLDPGPFGHPMMLGTGPEAQLHSQEILEHCQDRLRDLGIGALFGDSIPPLRVWFAVTRITEYYAKPGDIELVEAFRYYHVLGGRVIVEEAEEHEEQDSPVLIEY